MNESVNNSKPRALKRAVGFAIDKRWLFYVLIIGMAALCLFSIFQIDINNSLVSYMPSDSNSGKGYEIMESEFTDLVTAQLLLDNVSLDQCEDIRTQLSELEGVYSVEFDEKSYEFGTGVFNITLDYEESAEAGAVLEAIKETVELFDGGISSSMDSGWWWNIDFGIILLMVSAGILLIIALIYASRTYGDIIVMLVTVGLAVIINYGTNFFFGEISTITNLVAGIMQAALTMYYAALICRRYTRERSERDVRSAIITAVSVCMPKIMAGALFAVAAFASMLFADFRIGFEFGVVMIKGIVISVFLCIVLLPCLIMTWNKKIYRSRHKALLPKIKKRGKFTYKTKYAFPIIFVILAVTAITFKIVYPVEPYAYGGDEIMPIVKSFGQQVEYRVDQDFGEGGSTVYMLVPGGEYDTEKTVMKELSSMVDVISVTALSNSEAASYILADEISIWQFSDITGLDESDVWNIYSDYSELVNVETAGGIAEYEIPFIDVFMYTYDRVQAGSFAVNSAVNETLDKVYREIYDSECELRGETYDRMIIDVALPEDSNDAIDLIRQIRTVGQSHYEDTVYLTGDNGGIADMADSYIRDTIIVTLITVLILFIVFAIMLGKPWIALLMVLMVQGGVWISNTVPFIFPGKLMYIGDMLGYTLQMIVGVTYAAAMVNSYKKFKKDAPIKKAMGKALKENYTLVVVTASLFILSGLALGFLAFDKTVMALGFSISIGGFINLLLALFVIPQTLLLLDIIDRKIAKNEIVLTDEVTAPAEVQIDIVEAIERLKAAEKQNEEMSNGEREGEQPNETQK